MCEGALNKTPLEIRTLTSTVSYAFDTDLGGIIGPTLFGARDAEPLATTHRLDRHEIHNWHEFLMTE